MKFFFLGGGIVHLNERDTGLVGNWNWQILAQRTLTGQ